LHSQATFSAKKNIVPAALTRKARQPQTNVTGNATRCQLTLVDLSLCLSETWHGTLSDSLAAQVVITKMELPFADSELTLAARLPA